MGRIARGLIALSLLTFYVSAQVPNVDNFTSTPIPGAGHDYIHLPSETVNPANGSLSIRIEIPLPSGRGLSQPFFLSYDSDGLHYLASTGGLGGSPTWYTDDGYLSKGGVELLSAGPYLSGFQPERNGPERSQVAASYLPDLQ